MEGDMMEYSIFHWLYSIPYTPNSRGRKMRENDGMR
jgi:hypothetical protein